MKTYTDSRFKYLYIIPAISLILSLALCLFVLPDEIPTSFEAGTPASYGSKYLLLLLAFLPGALLFLFGAFPSLDADGKEVPRGASYNAACLIIFLAAFGYFLIVLLRALGLYINIAGIVSLLSSLLLFFLALSVNRVPFGGRGIAIRLRWIDNEETWRFTQKTASICFLVSGIANFISAVLTFALALPDSVPAVVLALTLLASGLAVIFLSYKSERDSMSDGS